ncbi:MAG: V-type ATPase subunit [Candidatus Woesearchaeota archaeon]
MVDEKSLPYTFARVSAMKSKLIKKNDYYKLLKLDPDSIIRFLQESEYKDVITKLSVKYSGLDLLDQALRKNKVKTFVKLKKISPRNVVEIINLYLNRWDYHNLKIVLRGIYSNSTKKEVSDLIINIGNFDKKHFINLFEKNSIIDSLIYSKIVKEKEIKNAIEEFKSKNRLIELENSLDQVYFKKAIDGTQIYGEYGKTLKDFLLRDIDINNIKNIIRFKKEGMDKEKILNMMIYSGKKLSKKNLEKIISQNTLKGVLDELKKTYYAKYIDFNDEEKIIDLEIALNNYNLKFAITKSNLNPMSIEGVISFMIRKMIEVRNIRLIVKSKYFDIDEDYIEKKLLIV